MKKETSKKKLPWTRWVILALLALLIGLNLYSFNATTLAGNQLPMPFGVGGAVVLSGSMEPTLSVNDLVIIREAEDYQIGDVVVYQSGKTLVIHRIIAFEGENFIAQGDANNASDAPTPTIYIKGKMALAIPYLGLFMRMIKSLPGTLVLIAAAVLLLEASWRKEKSKDMEQLDAIKEEIRRLQAELQENEKGE